MQSSKTLKPKFYAADCLRDLRELARKFDYPTLESQSMRQSFLFLADLLAKATCFIIPNAQEMLESDGFPDRDEFDHLHLPFPIVALEYDVECHGAFIHDVSRVNFKANKRVALAIDTTMLQQTAETLDCKLNEDWRLLMGEQRDGFIVVAFWYEVQHKSWVACSGAAFIDREQLSPKLVTALPVYTSNPDTMVMPEKASEITITTFPILPEMALKTIEMLGKERYMEAVFNDVNDEVHAILKFLTACQCRNVVVETLPRPKVLNLPKLKNRLSTVYHVLRVNHTQVKRKVDDQETAASVKRSSPRQHLRRGHARHYQSGLRIWINPQVVGAANQGKVVKDYLWT